jgi:hypothetical protein
VSDLDVTISSVYHLISMNEVNLDESRVSFIKIDCEGGEPYVLMGMRHLLERSSPMIWIEINSDSLRVAQSSESVVEGILRELGFATFLPGFSRSKLGLPRISLRLIESLTDDARSDCYDIVALKPGALSDLRTRRVSWVRGRLRGPIDIASPETSVN